MIKKISCGVVIYDEIADIKRLTTWLINELRDYSPQWIFVLNHEQPEIRHWIKAWMLENFKDSICIENPSNNLGYARQLILETATEDLVYMTDPDVEIKPGGLIKLIELARTEDLINLDAKTIGFGGLLIYRSNNLFLQKTFDFIFLVAEKIPFSFQIQHHSHLSVVDHIPSCHLLLKRKLALEIGGFSHQFDHVGEDLEFSHRAYTKGLQFIFSPKAAAYHSQNLTFAQWLYRVFTFGQVQVTVQKLHYRRGLRYYRLLPVLILFLLCLFSIFFFNLTLILISLSILIGFLVPGFLGFLLTALTYSLGEFAEMIYPVLEIKNATQLQEEKLNLETLVQRSKIGS